MGVGGVGEGERGVDAINVYLVSSTGQTTGSGGLGLCLGLMCPPPPAQPGLVQRRFCQLREYIPVPHPHCSACLSQGIPHPGPVECSRSAHTSCGPPSAPGCPRHSADPCHSPEILSSAHLSTCTHRIAIISVSVLTRQEVDPTTLASGA